MREVEYQPGDFVYVLDTAHIKGRAKKLDPPWKGPGIIVERLSPYIYRVRFENVIAVQSSRFSWQFRVFFGCYYEGL
jgi:hypothetical protein